MFRRKLIIIASGAAIIIFAFISMNLLSGMKKDPPKRTPEEIIRYVKANPITYNSFNTELKATGRLNSKSELVISAEVSGKILLGDIPFKRGQEFKEGDVLIKIYDKEALLDLKSRKSTFLNRMAVLLPDFKISFENSYTKWYVFFEKINIENDLPELPEFNSTQEKVFLASKNILTDYYSIKSDEIRLKKHIIKAPFNGALTEVNMEVGAIANPGAVLGRIINTIDLELEVPIEIGDAKWIKLGDKVTVANEEGTVEWVGRLTRKSKDIDITTQSVNVYVSLKSTPSKPLYRGQYLVATFAGINISNVMEIPRSAVFNNNEIFVVNDSLLTKEAINIKKINEKTVYFNGLVEGTNIVVEPLINARENTKVRIIQ